MNYYIEYELRRSSDSTANKSLWLNTAGYYVMGALFYI